jgi:SNF2 family DNA or RNA helicase
MQRIIDALKRIPIEDKAIVFSNFKSALDLLEGVCVDDLAFECARYDGDIDALKRQKELKRFKTTKACRFLFATTMSAGIGLNIVEANHVLFVDRWYNPTIHSQATDRCHRIGQTKVRIQIRISFIKHVCIFYSPLHLRRCMSNTLIL